MAEISLSPDPLTAERWKAGTDYLDALRRHGVRPEGLAWAIDLAGSFHLLMIISLVDRVGPRVIYDSLFKAYDSAVTPKSIDPWIVSAFSPKSGFGNAFLNSIDIKTEFRANDGSEVKEFGYASTEIGPFKIRENWIYVKMKPVVDLEAQMRGWNRFIRDVEQVAA
jgi:hypothetical protein